MKKVTKSKQRLFAQLNLAQKLNFFFDLKEITVSFSSNTYHATEHFMKPPRCLFILFRITFYTKPNTVNSIKTVLLHQELNLYLKFRVIFTYPNERKHCKSGITNEWKFNSNQYVICWKYLVLFQKYPRSISKRSQ